VRTFTLKLMQFTFPLALLGERSSAWSANVFGGSSGGLSAQATFNTFSSGGNNYLTVLLANDSKADVTDPGQVLTAVFWDPTANLTPVSAVLGSGSTVLFGTTDPGNVVGGEWAYKAGLAGTPGNAVLGISSAGFNIFGPNNLFPGTNLQGPTSPDGAGGGEYLARRKERRLLQQCSWHGHQFFPASWRRP